MRWCVYGFISDAIALYFNKDIFPDESNTVDRALRDDLCVCSDGNGGYTDNCDLGKVSRFQELEKVVGVACQSVAVLVPPG